MAAVVSKYSLPPGLYRLWEEIKNPRGDRRVRHAYWKRPVFASRQLFVVEQFDTLTEPPVYHGAIRPTGRHDVLLLIQANDDILALLAPRLVVEPESLKSILLAAKEHPHRISPEDVLEQLALDKIIEVGQVKWAIHAAREREKKE